MRLETPFHTAYRPREMGRWALARRPILARALRSDLVTPTLGVVLLWGEPFVGKTTLLRQVLWSLEPERFVAARVPIGALAEPIAGYSRAVRMLCAQISVQLGALGGITDRLRGVRTLPEALDVCMDAAAPDGRTLVLAVEGVDRYVGGVWPDGVKKNLASALSLVPEISLLLTSRLPLARLEAVEVPEQVRVHFVPPLEPEEARRLLTAPVRNRFEYTPEALDRLLAAAGGRPLLLQIIGRNCTRIAGAVTPPRIASSEAEEILTSCWLAGENLFRPLLANLLPVAQLVLAATALSTSPAMPSAKFERVFQHFQALGGDLSLAAFGNELSMLRLLRLVDTDDANAFWVNCGLLAEYLRAGVEEAPAEAI